MKRDLKTAGIGEDWYHIKWHGGGNGVTPQVSNNKWKMSGAMETVQGVICIVCDQTFRRESDKTCHKCIAERIKPICDQSGAVQCAACCRWFRSKGGLAVHRCECAS